MYGNLSIEVEISGPDLTEEQLVIYRAVVGHILFFR